jgi:hypothetical protein
MLATYFTGQSNQDNSCVAVMEGLRAPRRKLTGVEISAATIATKKFQSSRTLFLGIDP